MAVKNHGKVYARGSADLWVQDADSWLGTRPTEVLAGEAMTTLVNVRV